jgi:hypothetical protein
VKQFLIAYALLFTCFAAGQQLPCELTPEQQLPNCQFSTRSGGYGFRGPVHTVRATRRELAPDPRTAGKNPRKSPKLFIPDPSAWLVFSPAGEMVETAAALSADGTPENARGESRTVKGNTRITVTGPLDHPDSRSVETLDNQGRLTEGLLYIAGKLVGRHVVDYSLDGRTEEDHLYNGDGKLETHSFSVADEHGRAVLLRVWNGGRLEVDMRDTYDDSGDDDGTPVSRAWYDETGEMVRQIALRNGQMTWAWQKPDCGDPCKVPQSIGINFANDYSHTFEIEPDGSVLTTIQHHKGRYGNIENDDEELYDSSGRLLEKVAYRYVRDRWGNWTERIASIMDPATKQMIDVRVDTRDITYW